MLVGIASTLARSLSSLMWPAGGKSSNKTRSKRHRFHSNENAIIQRWNMQTLADTKLWWLLWWMLSPIFTFPLMCWRHPGKWQTRKSFFNNPMKKAPGQKNENKSKITVRWYFWISFNKSYKFNVNFSWKTHKIHIIRAKWNFRKAFHFRSGWLLISLLSASTLARFFFFVLLCSVFERKHAKYTTCRIIIITTMTVNGNGDDNDIQKMHGDNWRNSPATAKNTRKSNQEKTTELQFFIWQANRKYFKRLTEPISEGDLSLRIPRALKNDHQVDFVEEFCENFRYFILPRNSWNCPRLGWDVRQKKDLLRFVAGSKEGKKKNGQRVPQQNRGKAFK